MSKFVILIALAACGAAAGQTEMKPFPMEAAAGGGFSDVSFLLEAPAGRDGFIRVKDGHFAKPNGQRFRVWGVNTANFNVAPPKDDAPLIAANLARFGLNAVRFHFYDWTAPGGIIDANRNDTRALDPRQLDRMDFFVAELKKRGIYVDLNLNAGRTYKEGDGVRDYPLLGLAKSLTYFDDRLIMLEKEYAKELLTHFNPYTKAEYRNEPAVLMIELLNENSMVDSWVSNRLAGKQTQPDPGTWCDIPASYERELSEKFRQYLKRKGLPEVPRLQATEIAAAPEARFRTEASFYMEIEDHFFQSMRAYLKDNLGVKSLLAGTSDQNHTISGYPLLRSISKLDVVDGHSYWQHPRYIDQDGKRNSFTIGNSAMVNRPFNSSVVDLSRSAVAGKPYTVSEINHPFPSEYGSEGIPILGAYAALQDWDGIFWFTHSGSNRGKQLSFFDISPDPVKMTELSTGALMFLRHDVASAERTITRSYSLENVLDSLRMAKSERPYFTPGFPLSIPLQHQVRIAGFDGETTRSFMQGAQEEPIVSDTRQLSWYKGFVTVDTRRYQALVGYLKANRKELGNLSAEVKNNFGAITLAAMDGSPISRSAKLLLTAGSRVANTNQQWNEKRDSLVSWGTAPVVIEPVAGTVTLKNLEGATKVEVAALNAAGRPLGTAVPARKTAAGWEFPIGETVTMWYAITVAR